jgi:hypothetical protein
MNGIRRGGVEKVEEIKRKMTGRKELKRCTMEEENKQENGR